MLVQENWLFLVVHAHVLCCWIFFVCEKWRSELWKNEPRFYSGVDLLDLVTRPMHLHPNRLRRRFCFWWLLFWPWLLEIPLKICDELMKLAVVLVQTFSLCDVFWCVYCCVYCLFFLAWWARNIALEGQNCRWWYARTEEAKQLMVEFRTVTTNLNKERQWSLLMLVLVWSGDENYEIACLLSVLQLAVTMQVLLWVPLFLYRVYVFMCLVRLRCGAGGAVLATTYLKRRC